MTAPCKINKELISIHNVINIELYWPLFTLLRILNAAHYSVAMPIETLQFQL
jgi:hypothetical protein